MADTTEHIQDGKQHHLEADIAAIDPDVSSESLAAFMTELEEIMDRYGVYRVEAMQVLSMEVDGEAETLQ